MSFKNTIPVSVVVVTKNAAATLGVCLTALESFDDVWVVDSDSLDNTKDIAKAYGAKVQEYVWNGQYPKKRQWVLEQVPLKYPYVFFVDADEIVPPELVAEIAYLDWECAGYFVAGRYIYKDKILTQGLQNNKLCLLDRHKFHFPVIDDLDVAEMGEIEGHYQPVLKAGFEKEKIGYLRESLVHDAYKDHEKWLARHREYARWEAHMMRRSAHPKDPCARRERLKSMTRRYYRLRPALMFFYSYIWRRGYKDGVRGFGFALSRARYYRMINQALSRKNQ